MSSVATSSDILKKLGKIRSNREILHSQNVVDLTA